MDDTEEIMNVKEEVTSPVSVKEKRNVRKVDREEILRTAKHCRIIESRIRDNKVS